MRHFVMAEMMGSGIVMEEMMGLVTVMSEVTGLGTADYSQERARLVYLGEELQVRERQLGSG